MMAIWLFAAAAVGLVFLARADCMASRFAGTGILMFLILLAIEPARADQTIMAADSAQVDCRASARDLTRISLVEDAFASVSKISTGNSRDDFSVVNEPVRGDIYLSVPEGFARTTLSFFGTSKRGYVYKFLCRIGGDEAEQVFVSNPAILQGTGEEAQTGEGPRDAAVALIQGMASNSVAAGYEMRQHSLRPVRVGDLKVQMIAEYRGLDLSGKVLRLENLGKEPVALDEASIALPNTLALSIAQPRLEPGEATSAYLVSRSWRP